MRDAMAGAPDAGKGVGRQLQGRAAARDRVRVPPAQLRQMITDAAVRNGVDAILLFQFAGIESSFNPSARNPNSSAGGLFQFVDGTAKQYGLRDRFDPAQASNAAARLMRDNRDHLRNTLAASLRRRAVPCAPARRGRSLRSCLQIRTHLPSMLSGMMLSG